MTRGVDERNIAGMLRVLNETIEFMTREPALVKRDLPAWRSRLSQRGIRYVGLCQTTGHRVAWAPVVASLITARSIKYPLLLMFALLPDRIRVLLRQLKHAIS